MWNSGFESYSIGEYMQSQGGFGSRAPSSAEKKSRHIEPHTVSPMLSVTLVDEVFKIGSVEISQVTLVRIIRHAERASTNIVYKIDDMTAAPMDVHQWVDTDDTSSENTIVPPEKYVKVAGHLRSFQNKNSLVALRSSNSQPSAGRAPISNPGKSEAGYFGGNSFMPANGLTVAQNQVLNLIKACPRPEGLNFQDLKNQIKCMSISSVKQAMDFLSNEGPIYSTVDDGHFKSTDAE
uniref:Replication protein A C-terminal domain-containing protein n=1 Tax=Rhinopithecus bieti TaxID=61621 RepID=A0A2K6JP47_RHIBE